MRRHVTKTLLAQLLAWYGAVPQEALDEARQQQTKLPLGEILVSAGVLQQSALTTVLRAEARLRGDGEATGPRLLVVDDEPAVGLLYKEILTGAGYSVGIAESGAEALAAVFADDVPRPALIVLDLKMPGMSGFELLWALSRSLPRPIPAVALSGAYDDEIEARVKALGARAFLAKPAPARELLRLVTSILAEDALPA